VRTMMAKARSSPRWALRRIARSGWGSDKEPEYSPVSGNNLSP